MPEVNHTGTVFKANIFCWIYILDYPLNGTDGKYPLERKRETFSPAKPSRVCIGSYTFHRFHLGLPWPSVQLTSINGERVQTKLHLQRICLLNAVFIFVVNLLKYQILSDFTLFLHPEYCILLTPLYWWQYLKPSYWAFSSFQIRPRCSLRRKTTEKSLRIQMFRITHWEWEIPDLPEESRVGL